MPSIRCRITRTIRSKIERLVKIQNYHTQRVRQVPQAAVRPRRMATARCSIIRIILYGSNMSNSDLHNNDPLPSAVLGAGYGKIKGGQHLHYPQDTPHANLLLTLLDRAGVPVEKLGNSTGTVRGSLMAEAREHRRGALLALFVALACVAPAWPASAPASAPTGAPAPADINARQSDGSTAVAVGGVPGRCRSRQQAAQGRRRRQHGQRIRGHAPE